MSIFTWSEFFFSVIFLLNSSLLTVVNKWATLPLTSVSSNNDLIELAITIRKDQFTFLIVVLNCTDLWQFLILIEVQKFVPLLL